MYMKIELKLTADQIFATAKFLQQIYILHQTNNPQQIIHRSIAFDLEEKFTTKCKRLIKKSTIFEAKKTYKIILKYHEANTLQRVIYELLGSVNGESFKFYLQTVHDILHQKLA